MKAIVTCTAVGVLLLTAAARLAGAADSIVVAGRSVSGTFAGFENRRFVFEPAQGKRMQETSSRVSRLTLDPARTVSVFYTGNKSKASLTLKGFDKAKFILDDHGKDASELPSRVVKIIIADEAGSGDRSGAADEILVVDLKNLAAWIKENNPTPAQFKAFARYKAAREPYDAFLAENAAMVKAMNQATGSARTDLLDQLRQRRSEEPPLLRELKEAQKELLAAFPEIKPDPPGK